MIPFKAYTYEAKTYINDEAYQAGEILTYYLNRDFSLLALYYEKASGLVSRIYNAKDVPSLRTAIEDGQQFMTFIDSRLPQCPPYDRLMGKWHYTGNKLFYLYDEYKYLFESEDSNLTEQMKSWAYQVKGDEEAYEDDDYDDSDEDNDEDGDEDFLNRHNRRQLWDEPDDFDNADYSPLESEIGLDEDKTEFCRELHERFEPYLVFSMDVIRLQKAYVPLLDFYIHTGTTMPNAIEIANAITLFNEKTDPHPDKPKLFNVPARAYQLWPAENVTIAYESVPVDTPAGKQNVLCQTITYKSIGSFLYQELMNGLLSGMPPKRCKNCGKFFLLQNGYYTDYCDRIAPGETLKTCRDVGARKRFDEKVKQDPVWLAYQRAYKAHYARVTKKKMSKPDFAAWTEMAIALRTKALNKEIPFEEYERIIKE